VKRGGSNVAWLGPNVSDSYSTTPLAEQKSLSFEANVP